MNSLSDDTSCPPMATPICPICYDDISPDTGRTVLSCTHEFHLFCIASWFIQCDESSCPCCRKMMGKLEDLPTEADTEYESDDDTLSYESEDDSTYFTYAELNAFLRSKGGRGIKMATWLSMHPTDCQVAFTRSADLDLFVIGNGGQSVTESDWDSLPSNNLQTLPMSYESLIKVHLMADGTWNSLMSSTYSGVTVTLAKGEESSAGKLANLVTKKIQTLWRSR